MCKQQIRKKKKNAPKRQTTFISAPLLNSFCCSFCYRKGLWWWVPLACQETGTSPQIPVCEVYMQKASPSPLAQWSLLVAVSQPAGYLVAPELGACLLSSHCLPSSTPAAVPQQPLLPPVPPGARLRAAAAWLQAGKWCKIAGLLGSPGKNRRFSQGREGRCRPHYKCWPQRGGIKGKQLFWMGIKRAVLKWLWCGLHQLEQAVATSQALQSAIFPWFCSPLGCRIALCTLSSFCLLVLIPGFEPLWVQAAVPAMPGGVALKGDMWVSKLVRQFAPSRHEQGCKYSKQQGLGSGFGAWAWPLS